MELRGKESRWLLHNEIPSNTRRQQPTEADFREQKSSDPLSMCKLTPKWRHSLLQEAPRFLLRPQAERLSFSCEETQLGLSYLYQHAFPPPYSNLGETGQGSSSNSADGAGLPEFLLAPESRTLRMLPTRSSGLERKPRPAAMTFQHCY